MAKKAKKAEGLAWVGDGRHTIQGVPPRDLTAEEASVHMALIEATQKNTGMILYASIKGAPSGGDSDPESGISEGSDHG